MTRPLVVTPGEPAGIGPDIVLRLAADGFDPGRPWFAIGDPAVLTARADRLGLPVAMEMIHSPAMAKPVRQGVLQLAARTADADVTVGTPRPETAAHVLAVLRQAVDWTAAGDCGALVTGPIQKSVINDAGIAFTGHTETIARQLGDRRPVMMLAGPSMRVALATTHLPLAAVPTAVTRTVVEDVIRIVASDLETRFRIARPTIRVAGLNPHAGESGHLGTEDEREIRPAIDACRRDGIDVEGPYPADTLFNADLRARTDAFVAMYHDQGLPVVKALDFGDVVNVTLGLTIVRTSVDHGTALDKAGTGQADAHSLSVAMQLAARLVP
ncbi:4-hydroxythreonine-4-phosphate dehydrogenase PdxA [uncultured Abyssibacter sp.]|uniref:4-hydroxythreonine-4-phosphate dehydrogenase PdxA n=1 Tax=uncultured Abyssibacter sp. TaxID=2320202 RepID=UPI0032B2A838